MGEYGISDMEAKASFVKIFPKKRDNLIADIRNNFFSKDKTKIVDAVKAFIILLKQKDYIGDLLECIVQQIKMRTEVSIETFMRGLMFAMMHYQKLFSDNMLADVEIGLSYLLKELDIKRDDSSDIVHTKLINKKSMAELVVEMKKFYSKNKKSISQEMIEIEKSLTDENEFAEIRNILI